MNSNDVTRWFDDYLDAFAACGRGESETAALLGYYGVPLLLTTGDGCFALTSDEQVVAALLGYYGVPLLLTTGDGCFALTSDEQVVAALQPQVDGMRAAVYNRTEILGSEVTILNSRSALYRGTFSRQRSDGGEIIRLTATYLVVDGAAGRRVSVLAVHSP